MRLLPRLRRPRSSSSPRCPISPSMRTTLGRASLWQSYLAGGVILTALYWAVPPFRGYGPVINLLGVYGVGAVLVGVRRNRPRSRAPWLLFALGLLLFMARRRLHVQLPATAAHVGPVPVDRRRRIPDRLPGPDGRSAAARAASQPRARRHRDDRLADHDARTGARLLDRADRAVRPRQHDVVAAQARLDRVSGRRHHPARGRDPAGRRHRQAPAGLLPAGAQHQHAAGDRLRLWRRDARQRLPPPADPRHRLDRLLPVLGRRGPAPVDARARRASARPRAAADAAAPRAADRRRADRAGDRAVSRDSALRHRPGRHGLGLGGPVRARGRPDGRARPGARALHRP